MATVHRGDRESQHHITAALPFVRISTYSATVRERWQLEAT